jgi:hypothetical protein
MSESILERWSERGGKTQQRQEKEKEWNKRAYLSRVDDNEKWRFGDWGMEEK